MLKRQGNVVEAFEQASLAERVNRERAGKPGIIAYRAGWQIDMEPIGPPCRLRRPRPAEEFLDVLLREADRNHAVLETVVEKDVGEGRRDHNLETVIGQCPGGMLTARAAAEVAAGQEHTRSRDDRLVEFERGVRRPVGQKPPVEKEKLAETGPLDPLEELLGNDLVGIDVGPIERGDDAGVVDEWLHGWNEAAVPQRVQRVC